MPVNFELKCNHRFVHKVIRIERKKTSKHGISMILNGQSRIMVETCIPPALREIKCAAHRALCSMLGSLLLKQAQSCHFSWVANTPQGI